MKGTETFAIVTAPYRRSKVWDSGKVTWAELTSWLNSPAKHKECGNYVFGTLTGRTRSNRTVVSRSIAALDVDHPALGFTDTVELLLPCAVAVHTTYSSTPEEPRYRLWVPLSREATPAEYTRCCLWIMNRVGVAQFDPTTAQPARYMFKPATQRKSWFSSAVIDGDPLDVDWVIEQPLPGGDETTYDPERVGKNKRDPFALAGTVGSFNRVYTDLANLVETYELPYEQAEGRWHLRGAQGVAGLVEVAPGIWYSHHAGDPAGNTACTAFDLVRIHRFAELDEKSSPNTPITRLPSYDAMLKLAIKDADVIDEAIAVDFGPLPDAPDDDDADDGDDTDNAPDWRRGFRLNRRTQEPVDCVQNWDLICEHDPVIRSLRFNEMTISTELSTDPPWRKVTDHYGPTFTKFDFVALMNYLEREYRMAPPRAKIEDVVTSATIRKWYNPVREWLNSLEWDGTPRVEECLPGVAPTEYTRMVARKCLVAAVARMMDPGVKWDHSLVLKGPEGLGKSFWVERMSRGYSATLGQIGDKDTLLTMHRSWIMVADEGYSLKKADAEAQKEFLTRTTDVFRAPYDRETVAHPRHCVIWGTTNDDVFLRRQEGNRRFLIVNCDSTVDFDAMTEEYVEQVWAEAVELYRQGEPLFLSVDEQLLASEQREFYTEENPFIGIIERYLDTKVPEDWEQRTPEARQLWYQHEEYRDDDPGVIEIDRVCSVQIWVEMLGNPLGSQDRVKLRPILEALKAIPGWRKVGEQERVPNYGVQTVFTKTSDNPSENEKGTE